MKKIILMLALVLPMLASAQKLAHVNSQEIFNAMPELKSVQDSVSTLAGKYETVLANMQEEYHKKIADFQKDQSTMTAGVREFRQQEIAEIEQRIYSFGQTAQQDVMRTEQELKIPIQQKVLTAVKKVAEEQACTVVFETGMLHYIAPDVLDLMPLVKKELGIQ